MPVVQLPDGTFVNLGGNGPVGNFTVPQVPLVPPGLQTTNVTPPPAWSSNAPLANYNPSFSNITAAQMQAPIVGGMYMPEGGMRAPAASPLRPSALQPMPTPPAYQPPPGQGMAPPANPLAQADGSAGAPYGATLGAAALRPGGGLSDLYRLMMLQRLLMPQQQQQQQQAQRQQPSPYGPTGYLAGANYYTR